MLRSLQEARSLLCSYRCQIERCAGWGSGGVFPDLHGSAREEVFSEGFKGFVEGLMDPFESFYRLDFLIEPIFNENPLKSLVEDLFEEAVSFDFELAFEKFDELWPHCRRGSHGRRSPKEDPL